MAKVRELISEAMKDAGVLGEGNSLKAEDYIAAFRRLNWMLAQWNRKRWLVYNLVNYPVNSNGLVAYTVGPAGNVNIAERPDKLHSAFMHKRNTSGSFDNDFDNDFDTASNQSAGDLSLVILGSREDYNRIHLKRLLGEPFCVYYEPSFPLGTAFVWPAPPANTYTLNLTFKVAIAEFTSLDQIISLPAEYRAALHYNLAARLCVAYRKPISPELTTLIKDSLSVIRNANSQIPNLQMPMAVMQRGNYSWGYR